MLSPQIRYLPNIIYTFLVEAEDIGSLRPLNQVLNIVSNTATQDIY